MTKHYTISHNTFEDFDLNEEVLFKTEIELWHDNDKYYVTTKVSGQFRATSETVAKFGPDEFDDGFDRAERFYKAQIIAHLN